MYAVGGDHAVPRIVRLHPVRTDIFRDFSACIFPGSSRSATLILRGFQQRSGTTARPFGDVGIH